MASSRPIRVCVVCAGNICRSPMAEVVLRRKVAAAGLADAVEVDSAGTGNWHVGGDASRGALDAMRRRGYESAHAARQFDLAWFAERDLILALDDHNARDLRELAPDHAARAKVRMLGAYADGRGAGVDDRALSVPDPYGGTDRDFDHALDLIEAACDGFVTALLAGGPDVVGGR